jgi:uncharacterized protein (DUF1330 family)
VSVRFDPEKVYTLSGLWIRPDGGRERLQEYETAARPIVTAYGGLPMLRLTGVRSAWGDFLPTEVHLTEWPDVDAWSGYRGDARVARLAQIRDSALSKLTITRCRAQPAGH